MQCMKRSKTRQWARSLTISIQKMKASDNILLRSFTTLGSTIGSKLAKMKETNFTECMKAIKKHDKNFTPDNFVTFLKNEMIPTILEAGALNEVDIVDDWCLDTAAQRILMSHNVAKKEKLTYYERTLDLNKIDLAEAALED